ncbi:hypothetical protein B0H13DRAFT_2303626 [Mycena leptocephala]|nr:hypothetical protein B0H13DRAFT_2303626 [Mycena leptocephala]
MDIQRYSDTEFTLVSTSDHNESAPHPYISVRGQELVNGIPHKYRPESTSAVSVAVMSGPAYGHSQTINTHPREMKWQQHVAKYQSIRHPNIMQLYGLLRTGGLSATVFHNELIPFFQFLGRFKHSPVLTTYIWGYCGTEDTICPFAGRIALFVRILKSYAWPGDYFPSLFFTGSSQMVTELPLVDLATTRWVALDIPRHRRPLWHNLGYFLFPPNSRFC